MPPESTDGDAAPVELQHPPIEGVFLSGEIELTGDINRPPDKDEPSGEIEGGVSSAKGAAAELTCKVSQSPGKSEIKQSPESEEASAEMVKSTEVEMPAGMEDYSADKSSGEIDASKIKLSPENEESSVQQDDSSETEKSTTVVKSAEIEKPSQVDYTAEKSNGEIDATKIKLSPENEEPSAQKGKSTKVEMSAGVVESAAMEKLFQMENSVVNSSGEVDASKIKQSPENEEPSTEMENSAETDKYTAVEKSAQMDKLRRETSELILRETSEFILRLDPTGTVLLMCLASPLYVVLAAFALWLVADRPHALLWTFAHLVCLYLFCWIITLSTTRIRIVFLQITYVLMLAYNVVHLIAPLNGMMFLYTGMVYVAGMLGYAMAEHLQRAGFEQTANTLCSTPFNSKDHEEKVSIIHFCTVLMSSPILARMAWVFLVTYGGHMTHEDVFLVVVELTGEIFILAVLWILYITEFILRGALVSMERVAWTASICWLASGSLAMLLSFYIAEAVGMLIMWLGWMAIGGFFGYSLAVRACYCEMLTGSEKTPAAKEQNGGT